jgi:hypothetical protein
MLATTLIRVPGHIAFALGINTLSSCVGRTRRRTPQPQRWCYREWGEARPRRARAPWGDELEIGKVGHLHFSHYHDDPRVTVEPSDAEQLRSRLHFPRVQLPELFDGCR